MRLPNGFGNVSKLPGKRRRPYRARVTTEWWVDSEGKQHQKYKTIGYYKTRQEGILALLQCQQTEQSENKIFTFRELYTMWSSEHFPKISKTNIQAYANSYNLCSRLYDMEFINIRRVHMQSVIDNCQKNYPSLKRLKILFSQMYKYALQNDICEKDYSRYLDINQYRKRNPNAYLRKPFTEEEVNCLWKKRGQNPYCSTVLMMIYSGCRISELLNLKKRDVNLKEKWFYIREAKTEAGVRYVPIADKVMPFFVYWYGLGDCEYLISSPRNKRISYRNFYETYWKAVMEQMNMHHRPHDTRHTCVTMLTLANVNEKLIKRIVGHRGQDITDTVYTHFDISDMLQAINSI